MTEHLPPGLILILGAALVPLLKGRLRNAYMLALPVAGLIALTQASPGDTIAMELFGYALTPVRVDRMSLAFGYIFHLAAAIAIIYAFHIRDTLQQAAALIYAGCAIAAVFAGDLVTLFVFWEGTAIASTFLIWASRTEAAYRSGMRYLIIQVGSGVLLLAGAIVLFRTTGSLAFDGMNLSGPGPLLIFLAFGIKAAFPLLHSWVPDAYPRSTVTGTVFLSIFTTKLAIYTLARGFPGTEILIWIGVAMALFTIVLAILENDLRRVIAYSLINQLGFMIAGIGIGSEMALNGAVAHACASVLYQGLLFMALGAVLMRTGTAKANELGGLYRTMPLTAACCAVAAASIAALPLFSGFVSKPMIIGEAAHAGHLWAWFALLTASAAVVLHTVIKVAGVPFFGPNRGLRPAEAPGNMRAAMGAAAVLCVLPGVAPGTFYELLPFPLDYRPYTTGHVVTQLQLVALASLGYVLLNRFGLYPRARDAVVLDVDWIYRRLAPAAIVRMLAAYRLFARNTTGLLRSGAHRIIASVMHDHRAEGILAQNWPMGSTVLWVAVLLVLYMAFFFL